MAAIPLPALPFLAKAKVSWTGEEEGDLGFLENEQIKVFNIVDESWWQGSLCRNGHEGIFPKDFVDVLVDLRANSARGTPTKKVATVVPTTSRDNTPVKSPPPNSLLVPSTGGTPTKKMPPANKFSASSYRHSQALRSSPGLADSLSRLYSQYVLNSGLTGENYKTNAKAHTSDDLMDLRKRSEAKQRLRKLAPRSDDVLETINYKKQQLELELLNLRRLEQSHLQKHAANNLDSYVSEDIMLSRRNYSSRDDLADYDDDDDSFRESDLRNNELRNNDLDDDYGPPPPPKGLANLYLMNAPFGPEDFRASGNSQLAASQRVYLPGQPQTPNDYLKSSMKSLQSDVLNLSELSATSAGSFIRHKYERDMADADTGLGAMRLNDDSNQPLPEVMDMIFKDKKSKHPNIFRMLKKKKPEQNLMEQRLQHDDHADWQVVKADFNRMNTLTSHDKQLRTKRAVRAEPNFIAKPLDFITDINESEVFGPDEHVTPMKDLKVNTRKVADFLDKYTVQSDFNDLVSDISVKFGTWRPNEIRAVLLHLCKFKIIEEPEQISQTKPKLSEVMLKGEATIFQLNYLFKKLLDALKIPAEVVLGFWKKPNEFYHDEQYVINHCWLSVMVETDMYGNGSFRLVDLMCFQNGSICNKPGFNEFYFLAEPLDVISTHIPSVIEFQHVCPPVDLNIAYHLPRAYSGWNRNRLRFVNFNNSLTRMRDLEFFEADILVPIDVELFTLIKTAHTTSNDFTLCQMKWVDGARRIARIKAILPEKEDVGVLQIFAGRKGLQTHFDNIHELACVLPLYHFGSYKPCRFVPRFPTIQSQSNDLYIKHPQLSSIVAKNSYNFEVEAHPSMGLGAGLALMNQDFKLVIESPSGKYTRLVSDDPLKPYGTYSATIYANELGVFRALVIGDSGSSWYVFAQWECVTSQQLIQQLTKEAAERRRF